MPRRTPNATPLLDREILCLLHSNRDPLGGRASGTLTARGRAFESVASIVWEDSPTSFQARLGDGNWSLFPLQNGRRQGEVQPEKLEANPDGKDLRSQ